jgi:hypothetical protein
MRGLEVGSWKLEEGLGDGGWGGAGADGDFVAVDGGDFDFLGAGDEGAVGDDVEEVVVEAGFAGGTEVGFGFAEGADEDGFGGGAVGGVEEGGGGEGAGGGELEAAEAGGDVEVFGEEEEGDEGGEGAEEDDGEAGLDGGPGAGEGGPAAAGLCGDEAGDKADGHEDEAGDGEDADAAEEEEVADDDGEAEDDEEDFPGLGEAGEVGGADEEDEADDGADGGDDDAGVGEFDPSEDEHGDEEHEADGGLGEPGGGDFGEGEVEGEEVTADVEGGAEILLVVDGGFGEAHFEGVFVADGEELGVGFDGFDEAPGMVFGAAGGGGFFGEEFVFGGGVNVADFAGGVVAHVVDFDGDIDHGVEEHFVVAVLGSGFVEVFEDGGNGFGAFGGGHGFDVAEPGVDGDGGAVAEGGLARHDDLLAGESHEGAGGVGFVVDPGDGGEVLGGEAFGEFVDGEGGGDESAVGVDVEDEEGAAGLAGEVDAAVEGLEHDVVNGGVEADEGGFVVGGLEGGGQIVGGGRWGRGVFGAR